MGRPRKTLAERGNTLPARFRPDKRMLSWDLDWDSALGIEIMGELYALSQDLGGWESLSRQRQILTEKAVFLYLWTVRYESALFTGKPLPFDAGAYHNKLCDLKGFLKDLGLERTARTVGLREHLQSKGSRVAT